MAIRLSLRKPRRLLFLIGDVDGGDQPAHAARRAPQRQQQARDGGEAERAARRLHQTVQLLAQKFLRLRRQNAGERRHLPLDLAGVEDEPVERNERRQAGEQRQQDRVGDAARDEEEVLIRDFAPGAPENVLPAARRYLAGMIRLASAPAVPALRRLRRSAQPRKIPLKLLQARIAAHWPWKSPVPRPQATGLRLRALNARRTGQVLTRKRSGPQKPVYLPKRASDPFDGLAAFRHTRMKRPG